MPVKSTASKSASAPKARKTRTRKTNTRSAKTLAAPQKVTATVRKVKAVKPVSKIRTLKNVKRPSTARLITPQRYIADIQTRWAIHNFEIQELISDFMKGFEALKPYHAELVKMVKD